MVLFIILIIGFLGLTRGPEDSRQKTLRARYFVLVLYILLLVFSGIIYALGIFVESLYWTYICPDIVTNPIMFMIFLCPPVAFMYLDARSTKPSEIYSPLTSPALVLLVWLIVLFFVPGICSVILY
ncbi:MAG: hypothetical protein ACFFEA_06735 [Candidatus Thorarchaeota archaeon]